MKEHLTSNSGIGLAFLKLVDRNLIAVSSDCSIETHTWRQNHIAIERHSKKWSKKIRLGKGKNKEKKLSESAFSHQINNRNLCFAVNNSGSYVIACGFEDFSFVVYEIANKSVCQTVTYHTDIVSCLAMDENEKQCILVTGVCSH